MRQHPQKATIDIAPSSPRRLKYVGLFLCGLLLIAAWQACAPKGPGSETPATEQSLDAGQQDTTTSDGGPGDNSPTPDAPGADEPTADNATPPDAADEPAGEAEPSEQTTPETTQDAGPRKTVFGGKRPATLKVPPDYDHAKAHPLVVLLHGYGATGAVQSFYFGVQKLTNEEGVLVIAPDGTKDPTGKQFWNATPACCDFARSGVDDVAYLLGLVKEIQAEYNVDKQRIYFIGHSNGGFMSHRMACEASDVIAGIVSLAGATFSDDSACKPSNKISVLQIHGTKDTTILYTGGANIGNKYPSAKETVAKWAKLNGCTGQLKDSATKKDLESNVQGDETTQSSYEGCPQGIDAALWTMTDAGHVPAFTPNYISEVWQWMKAHPKQP